MKRTEKFAELRKKLKQDLRNPGCIELDAEINKMTAISNLGKVNTPLLLGIGGITATSFLVGYGIGKTRRK